MENGKNYIENLYSNTFGNYKDTPTNDEWNVLSTKLVRVNFMKFSFTTFNVFYLSTILALAGTTVYFGVNNYKLSKKNNSLEMQIEKINQSIIISNVSVPNANYDKKVSSIKLQKVQKNSEISSVSKQVELSNNGSKKTSSQESVLNSAKTIEPNVAESEADKPNEIVTVTDTMYVKTDSARFNNVAPKKIKKIRKTVYVKQSQVVVKDSIVVNNKVK